MKKILIPTDFSESAATAVGVAYEIAKRYGSELVVLHVVEEVVRDSFKITGDLTPESGESKLFTYKLLEQAKEKLEKVVMNPEYKDIKVIGELRLGNPFHGMNKIIVDEKVDLVVMGTQGHTKVEEMLIGSNTERVVRHCKHPVLTIHSKPHTCDFKNIVYATSLKKEEEKFACLVKDAQRVYNSKIHLLRVNTPSDFKRDVNVKEEMLRFAKSNGLTNYTINVFNDMSEEEGIIYFSESINADLIAMATHGRTGFAHVLSGSIAEEVVGHAKRPVLTYVI